MDETWYTLRQAARRVNRSLRTIRRWVKGTPDREGMPTRLIDGRREVREDILLATYRDRLAAWPPQQYRIRAHLRALEEQEN